MKKERIEKKKSEKGNKREFIEKRMNQTLFLRNELLDELFPSMLQDLETEKKMHGMYIDFYAIHKEKNVPIYFELQKDSMDSVHFEKVEKLVHIILEGFIIWISTKANLHLVKKLRNLAKESGKQLEILIVEIDENFVSRLEELQKRGTIVATETIMSPRFKIPPLRIIETIPLEGSFIGNTITKASHKGNEKINNELIAILRQEYPYFLNVLRSKRNLHQKNITFGSGTCYIIIEMTAISTARAEAKLELKNTNLITIEKFLEIQDRLHAVKFTSPVSFDGERFTIHYGTKLSTKLVFEKLVEDFGKLIGVLIEFHE